MFDYRRVHPDVQVSAIPKTTYKQHVTHHIQEVSAVSAVHKAKHHFWTLHCAITSLGKYHHVLLPVTTHLSPGHRSFFVSQLAT
jgi:hypothetical protein